jgi:Protein of unknown function (DUF3631)
MHSKQKQTLQQKSKHMITAQNAEYQVAPVALRPDSDSSIENQNGRTSLVGGTGSVSNLQNSSISSSSIENRKSKIENCSGQTLLNDLESLLQRHVILPAFAPETLALWVLHTYAFELRDVSTYLGIESPEKRCGKTTLLSVLNRLANRPVAAANISPSAFFRVIEDIRPTLLIDEADTFLRGNDEIRGILNAGYTRDTAYVMRVTQTENPKGIPSFSPGLRGTSYPGFEAADVYNPERVAAVSPAALDTSRSSLGKSDSDRNQAPSDKSKFEIQNSKLENPSLDTRHPSLGRFSCWCPKVMAAIGRLPDTLADRCIIIRMQRKHIDEECERLRDLDTTGLRERCIQFVKANQNAIATARPQIPDTLHDRAADIWEPLLVLAGIAGGEWPAKARRAAQGLTDTTQGRSPIGALLFDIFRGICLTESDRISSHGLVYWLNQFTDRPWHDLPRLRSADCGRRKEVTELWLAQQLRPYGIRPKTIRISDKTAKGYLQEDMLEIFQRYIPRSEVDAFKADLERQAADRAKQHLNAADQPPA